MIDWIGRPFTDAERAVEEPWLRAMQRVIGERTNTEPDANHIEVWRDYGSEYIWIEVMGPDFLAVENANSFSELRAILEPLAAAATPTDWGEVIE